MKIIITAFIPFGNINFNSSQEVIKRLKDRCDLELKKIYLDVIYNPSLFTDIIKEEKPDIIIFSGQAQGRKEVCIEQVGINLMHSTTPDNLGVLKTNEAICDNDIDGLFSTIPTFEIVNKLKDYPVKLSLNAGSFVCNLSLYSSLLYCKQNNLKTKVGFIHYPLYNGQINEETKSLDLDLMVEITEKIIDILTK